MDPDFSRDDWFSRTSMGTVFFLDIFSVINNSNQLHNISVHSLISLRLCYLSSVGLSISCRGLTTCITITIYEWFFLDISHHIFDNDKKVTQCPQQEDNNNKLFTFSEVLGVIVSVILLETSFCKSTCSADAYKLNAFSLFKCQSKNALLKLV